MIFLNQFYDFWNKPTYIEVKFDYLKVFRLIHFIKHLMEIYFDVRPVCCFENDYSKSDI